LGCISEPPHCPFDRKIIGKLKLDCKINFTKMDSADEYLKLVDAARNAAKSCGLSVAVWELKIWSRKTS
jgi:thermostable 8-oxoguanine DNA glycosylase